MNTHDFYYDLPPELIAQHPAGRRDHSRLMLLDRTTGRIGHAHFYDLPKYLRPEDCLILNDTRVLPARIYGTRRDTGAVVEFLLLSRLENGDWEISELSKPIPSESGPKGTAKRLSVYTEPDEDD